MIDILGWGEWIVIIVLALVIIDPKDLPRILHQLGGWLQRFKNATSPFRQEFDGLMRLEQVKKLPLEDALPDLSHVIQPQKKRKSSLRPPSHRSRSHRPGSFSQHASSSHITNHKNPRKRHKKPS